MKRLFILGLFLLGLVWAIVHFPGLAAQGTYDSIVVDFREDVGAAKIEAGVKEIARRYHVQPRLNSAFSTTDNIYVFSGNSTLLRQLKKSDIAKIAEFIEPDYLYSIPEGRDWQSLAVNPNWTNTQPNGQSPNDPLYIRQWNLKTIDAEVAWEDSKGSGVTVAVIDTGVSQVPDLKATKLVAGYDFVNDRTDASDDNGHGTHVAGTIAQATNNSYGVAGVAYEAALMPLKVLSAGGGGTVTDIAEAIRFAADNGADVINMSLGGGGESSAMKQAIDYAHNKGLVIIAAAGNENRNSVSYPARYPHVIGVAATDAAGGKAPYSNFGAGIDIAAPGGSTVGDNSAGGILQETVNPRTGEYIFAAFQGTSMAAPHVAGVAALVKSAGIKAPDDIEAILLQSARKVQDDDLNHFGAGKLDAASAVKLALRGQITFRDFFRWLRDNGYLSPGFWLDGGIIALWPKVMMVLGSYLLAWVLRNYFPFAWSGSLTTGLIAGSSGLWFLKGIYLFDLPQWPLRVMGSSIPELGSAIEGGGALNPFFASVLIPVGLTVLLWGHAQWKWFAVGSALGVAACLGISAVIDPQVMWLGDGAIARSFLAINALLCFGLAKFISKPEGRLAS